jgi:hypothetical protein
MGSFDLAGELMRWRNSLRDADRLARCGAVGAGYECLLLGLVRAIEAAAAGERDAEDLIGCYRLAMNDYIQRHRALHRQ